MRDFFVPKHKTKTIFGQITGQTNTEHYETFRRQERNNHWGK